MPSAGTGGPGRQARPFPRLDLRDTATLDSGVAYNPDLKDGMLPDVAPSTNSSLWKGAKSCRDEPRNIVHEGSSIAQRLRARGLVKGEEPAVRPEEPSDAPR
jgi:hypothetical protein